MTKESLDSIQVLLFSSEAFFVVKKLDALGIVTVFISDFVQLMWKDGRSTKKYTNVRSVIKTENFMLFQYTHDYLESPPISIWN